MSDDSFSNKPLLLSGAISETLGLTKIYADEIHSISVQEKPLIADAIDLCFADVFQGLGLVGEPLLIDVDPTYEATQVYPRHIPVNKKEKVRAKLDEMVKRGTLVPITVPTKWSSNCVVVGKV